MDILYKLLLVVHISAAAITLGASTGLLKHLRATLAAGMPAFGLAAEDALRRRKIMGLSGVILLQSGVALIFVLGGFKAVPLNIHMALGIMLVALAVGATVSLPASAKLVTLSKTAPLDHEKITIQLKKIAMGQGVSHLCWLIILILMFVRIEK